MAKESEKSTEIALKAIDAAIASLRAQDWDLNPYSIAAAAEMAPEAVFGNKAAMDRIMEARGDGSTYSYDSELASRCKELAAELENATVINQDLFDRGSELAERVVELEANVTELEQEAETLALQLQNSWSIGYQKGLAEGKEKAEAAAAKSANKEKEAAPVAAPVPAPVTAVAEPVKAKTTSRADQRTIGTDTDEELPVVERLHNYDEGDVKDETQSSSQAPAAEPQGEKQNAPVNLPVPPPASPLKATTYNDQNYNAVSDHRSPVNVSEVYGSLSWKQIETVYQYSTVAGRPNTNLYFEPLSPPHIEEETVESAAPSSVPAPAEIEPEAKNRKKSSMPDISFDPPDEPIVGTSSGAEVKLAPSVERAAPPTPEEIYQLDYVNQYDGGLTGENYPSLSSMQAGAGNGRKLDNRTASATFDKLDALPASDEEVPDILDLDKLDIFEGLEDMNELNHIEVIEDVIITPTAEELTKARMASQSETAAMPKVSNEDLRDLIKTRIKQAQGDDPNQPHSVDQLMEGAVASTTSTPPGVNSNPGTTPGDATTGGAAGSTTGDIPGSAAIDLEAIRQGARNKFVGGKTLSAPTGGLIGETTEKMPPASAPLPRVPQVPADIRKHCMILGVRPEELTTKIIIEAWKAQIAAPGVHPDQGGDTETAVYLNLAKDTLVKWVENQAPKLGKKFGQQGHKDTDKK